MAGFFEETWILWWIYAVVVILRWFYVNWVADEWDVHAPESDTESYESLRPQLFHASLKEESAVLPTLTGGTNNE